MSTEALEPLAYRVNGVVAVTGLPRTKVYELMASGQLPYTQVGGVRLITRHAVERLLAGDDAD